MAADPKDIARSHDEAWNTNKIVSEHISFDQMAFMTQIGAMPQP